MIELTDWLTAELIRRADREVPLECCGLISRAPEADPLRPGHISLWEAENAAERPETSFFITPEAQFGLLKQIALRGDVLAGVYHSHPRSGPEPSERDRAIAYPWSQIPGVDLTWVIVGRTPCECLPVPMMGGYEDNDLIPDGDCEKCGDAGFTFEFWAGRLP